MAELKMDEFVKNVGQKVAEGIKQNYIKRDVLEQIRAEIADLDDAEYEFEGYYKAVNDALQIIDKYR